MFYVTVGIGIGIAALVLFAVAAAIAKRNDQPDLGGVSANWIAQKRADHDPNP